MMRRLFSRRNRLPSAPRAWRWPRVRINPDLVVFVIGLLLAAGGLSWAWAPLGPICAGLVLMGVALFGGGKAA